jgi:hypothetical protein
MQRRRTIMIIETDDYGQVDIGDLEGEALAAAYADTKAYCDQLEATFGRYAGTLAMASTSPTKVASW